MSTRSISRTLFLFFLAGLLVAALAALLERIPGYMDADYYFASGQAIAQGNGFSLPLLWNYLDDPVSVLHPSHTYWMPLVSLVAAIGVFFGGQFSAARIPFILIAGLVPPLTVLLGLRLHGNLRNARLGGIFALLPVYYLAYLPTSDSFPLLMVIGGWMLLMMGARSRPVLRAFGLGFAAGLLHLTRADGVLWLAAVFAWSLWDGWMAFQGSRSERLKRLALRAGVGLAGYLIPMSFWYARNLIEWGQLFPPGGNRTFWLTQYEDTFLYPGSLLTYQRWLASGWQSIFTVRANAVVANLQTFAAVEASVRFFPFILLGLWQMWKGAAVRIGLGMWVLVFGLMSIVFPFAGTNGAFFHSGAVFQPLFWAAAPVGIEWAVAWAAKQRKWQRGATVRLFLEVVLVAVCLLLSLAIYFQRVATWNGGQAFNLALERRLVALGANPGAAVMINTPPGYYLATGRPALVIPFGDESAVVAAGTYYKARYLILDPANAWYMGRLYDHPGDYPGLHFLESLEDARIYAFTTP